jgi:aminoglycoside phosphotransferase (APT) family kinase protein
MKAPEAPHLPEVLADYTLGNAAGLGWTNTVYALQAPGRRGFFRAPRSETPPPGVDWAREGALLASAGSLAAPVLFFDPDTGRLATEARPGTPLGSASLKAGPYCLALGQQLRQVHALPCPEDATPFHPARYALRCLHRAGAQGISADPRWQGRLEALLPYPLRSDRLTHNDLHGGNVLRHGTQFTFLDWELASPGDPRFDLVTLATHLGLGRRQAAALFSSYGAVLPSDREWRTLETLHWLREYAWALWARGEGIREAEVQEHQAAKALARLEDA